MAKTCFVVLYSQEIPYVYFVKVTLSQPDYYLKNNKNIKYYVRDLKYYLLFTVKLRLENRNTPPPS